MLWLQPMPQPYAVFPTAAAALRRLRERVAAANGSIAVPDWL